MLLNERVARIRETDDAIARLSGRVQGMMLLGQDQDVKHLAIALAREAERLARLCGHPAPTSHLSAS